VLASQPWFLFPIEPDFHLLSQTSRRNMNPEELKPEYEHVFTVTDYYDGPRKGIANFLGKPHLADEECCKNNGENGTIPAVLVRMADCRECSDEESFHNIGNRRVEGTT
jgi:hypothetical protein